HKKSCEIERSSKAKPWTPLIPSSIHSETSLRIAFVSLSVVTNQIAKIHESCCSYSDWVRCDGIRGLLCEAHLYSDQQHHRRCHLGSKEQNGRKAKTSFEK
ncbi:hypothetical protein IGI04_005817, partial [Brassica rapa subsp. trilocularis]